MIRFALSLFVALIATAGVSLAWPKFMKSPIPQPLSKIHDIVIQTPLGSQFANVLGVKTDGVAAVNMKDIAASAAGSLVSGVEQKTTEILVGQLLLQLDRQIEKLPPEEQSKIRQVMCKTPTQ